MRFDDKVVLISGAAGGFGSLAAKAFSDLGASLILADRDQGGLDAIAKPLGDRVATLAGDVTDRTHHHDLVALALSEFGALDIAVNNAGIVQPMTRIPDTDAEIARTVIDIDLMGVFWALQAQLPVMARQFETRQSGGAIVNVASAAGLVGSPFLAIYSAAKHGVVGLTRSAAAEYGRKGVRVNAVCPSFADTAMLTEALDSDPKGREAMTQSLTKAIPMGRIARADEVVQAILFAASEENSFMTGETLSIDGGLAAV